MHLTYNACEPTDIITERFMANRLFIVVELSRKYLNYAKLRFPLKDKCFLRACVRVLVENLRCIPTKGDTGVNLACVQSATWG